MLGTRLASSLIGPLVKRLFVQEGSGAGLVGNPERLSALVSFRGEKRELTEKDVRKLAARLVRAAVDSPGEPPFPPDEETAVTDGLAHKLFALGDLDMNDVQAVQLGYRDLAHALHRQAPTPADLSADASYFLESLTEWACLHIVHFFTQRSTFQARTLLEHSRLLAEIIAKLDELIRRNPLRGDQDAAFEGRYRSYIDKKHSRVTIYGVDLLHSPDHWPLEGTYSSLEAALLRPPTSGLGEGHVSDTVRLPAEKLFQDGHDRNLLLSDTGSGKTVLIQWLAVEAARQVNQVPFVLPLRDLTPGSVPPSPERFLSFVGCPLQPPAQWAERVLTNKRGTILVDGLDAIPTADRLRIRGWLADLMQAFPDNRWLVTSRPTAVHSGWLAASDFRELVLTPMRRTDVTDFVHRWHMAVQAADLEEPVLHALRTRRHLTRLATSPLMCALICALHREGHEFLHSDLKGLYDAALSMLLTRRDRERGMRPLDDIDLNEEQQTALLQRLAYTLILSGRKAMERFTAEGLLERCLPSIASLAQQKNVTAVLDHLLLRSGLLRRLPDDGVAFLHDALRDYLGAQDALEKGHIDVLARHADDSSWEAVIRMAVAHARPRERAGLLRQLLARGTPRCTVLALACLEHASLLDPVVRREVESKASALVPPCTEEVARTLTEAGPLVLELLPGPDSLSDQEAYAVAVTASLLGTDGALAVLRRYREHPSPAVREQLAGAWSQFDTDVYLHEVLEHLDPTGLSLAIDRPDQLRTACRLPASWSSFRLQGPHDPQLLEAALPDVTRQLFLSKNSLLIDLGPLLTLTSLRHLALDDCPGVTDLSPLAQSCLVGLRLGRLRGLPELNGLKSLSTLRSLSVRQQLPGDALTDSLPVEAELDSLHLSGRAARTTGFRGLSHWRTLRELHLDRGVARPTTEDWAEVAALPALGDLFFHPSLLSGVTLMPILPQVTTLHIAPVRGTEHLSLLSERLPGLNSVVLQGGSDASLLAERCADLFPQAYVTVEER
ncbi:NACHT domain-containing protein [Streptomyces sp. NPDC050564]|uniref:NACHT domain-containing protein n=1 Tax=Streptomyces sp. NPDC050564 TaxID=3365631 RepID=UPI0037886DAB